MNVTSRDSRPDRLHAGFLKTKDEAASRSQRRRRPAFRPAMVDLEPRTLMAGGVAAAADAGDATSVFMSEVATEFSDQPLPSGLVGRLERGLRSGGLTREDVVLRVLQTPRVREGLTQGLTEYLLDREPTAAESRALAGDDQAAGADVPGVLLRIMRSPEYFRRNGGTNAAFLQAVSMDLLHRPATESETATIVPRLDLGGSPARAQYLRGLIGGDEFRLFHTVNTYQTFTGTAITPDQQAAYLDAYRGPMGYSKMVARVLGSDAVLPAVLAQHAQRQAPGTSMASMGSMTAQASAAEASAGATSSIYDSVVIPTLDENPGLSVKRVPGYLAGPKFGNVAAPYNLANASGRQIDDATVDYWAITLNKLDTVSLTVSPVDGKPASGFSIRVWGPDGKEVGSAPPGGVLTYVAAEDGTYTIGISTTSNANYPFNPQGSQPSPGGPTLRAYTAEFSTYPGPNTSLMQILQTYTNPEYTDGEWPAWAAGQAEAYANLTAIATAGANVPGSGLRNFNDFRHVGDVTDPQTISGWLTAAWTPFKTLLDDPNNPQIVAISFGQTFDAFTLAQWTTIADAILKDSATASAYTSVHGLLAAANEDRSNISVFLSSLDAWSTNYEELLLGDAPAIAQELQTGLTQLDMSQSADKLTVWNDLLTILARLAGTLGGAIAGPAGSAIGVMVGSTVADVISYWLGQEYQKKPQPTPVDLNAAAQDIQSFSKDAYLDAFEALTNESFVASLFSNYGLLEAMGNVQFAYSPGDKPTPANVLQQSYDESVWKQLVPRMFSWKNLGFTDASTMPAFTNFIPTSESATWQNPWNVLPLHCKVFISACWWRGWDDVSVTNQSFGVGDPTIAAGPQVTALQSGSTFDFSGYDAGPNNWWGPGPVSGPRTLTGDPSRFYAITPSAHLSQDVVRYVPPQDRVIVPFAGAWETKAEVDGGMIQEWALVTADDKQISPAAAAALFGVVPPGGLQPTQSVPKPYKGGVYYDYAVPAGGLVSRFDVFSSWGTDVPNFSPYSFQPGPFQGYANVGVDPRNQYDPFDPPNQASFKITFGS